VTQLRSLRHNQRGAGASVAVAVIMSMILVVALVQNVYIWGQTLTNEESDRVHESITIQQIYVNNSSDLVVVVKNTGSVDSHLVAVWIESMTAPNESHRFMINEYVSIEEIKDVVLDDSILGEFNLDEDHKYSVVTERGNLISDIYPHETIESLPEVYYLGVFGVDWFYCKYSSEQNQPNGTELEDASYIIKSNDYVAFYMKIINSWDYPCAITSDSFLALTTIAPSEGEPSFYIVQNLTYSGNDPTLTAYNDSTPIIVAPNQSQILVFASKIRGEADWQWAKVYPFGPETTTDGSDIQISLFYDIYEGEPPESSGKYYGQAISTHAVVLLEK
jgi:hypothetical protein